MKNKIVIHKNISYSKIIFKYFIALIPLILYGLYKNGIILYVNQEIGILGILTPILYPVLGMFAGLLVNFIKNKKLIFDLMVLNGFLVGMLVPINTNLIIFSVLTFGFLYVSTLIQNKFKFNVACLIKLLIILFLVIINKYNYGNLLEVSSSYDFTFMDLLFGRQIGGVCASSFIWIIIGFIYLLSNYYYKREIPIIAYLSYVAVILCSFIFTNDFYLTLTSLIAATPLFGFVFLAPISEYSPYTNNGKIVYAILLGVLTALLGFVIEYEAVFIIILLLSILRDTFDKIYQKSTK